VLFALLPIVLVAGAGTVWAATNNPDRSAEPNPNCTLIVPPDPLSAKGLATPYRLLATNRRQGACHERNPDQAAFVQATIVDPATGKLFVYNPLVIDLGTAPAVAPVVPELPAGAVVGLWFGSNGDTLTLWGVPGALASGRCVNGLRRSPFGQFAYCNAPAFFAAANAAIAAGRLPVPDLGMARDNLPCPSTRDFSVVDQDQSDNVTSTYLVLDNGRTAQNSAANRAKLTGSHGAANGSDNRLLDAFVDPALGCTPFTAPDLGDAGRPATSLALNELQAAAHQGAPIALIPPNNPMVLVDDKQNLDKTNAYRMGVDMPRVNRTGSMDRQYCRSMVDIGQRRIQLDRNLTSTAPSPDPEAADSLFTFLAARLQDSFEQLGCGDLLRSRNPVKLISDSDGVTVDAKFAKPVDPLATGEG
jgi:hypothetical protein